uniref:Uncharacterized protein n=1 Tax=Arundo donax TaxID=35708 RepID=A0A0A9AHE9_ARUDO
MVDNSIVVVSSLSTSSPS